MSQVLIIVWLVFLALANVAIVAIAVWVVASLLGWIVPFDIDQWVKDHPDQPKPELVGWGVSLPLLRVVITVIVADLAAVIITLGIFRRNRAIR